MTIEMDCGDEYDEKRQQVVCDHCSALDFHLQIRSEDPGCSSPALVALCPLCVKRYDEDHTIIAEAEKHSALAFEDDF